MLRQASQETGFEGESAYLYMYFRHHFTDKPGKDDLKSEILEYAGIMEKGERGGSQKLMGGKWM